MTEPSFKKTSASRKHKRRAKARENDEEPRLIAKTESSETRPYRSSVSRVEQCWKEDELVRIRASAEAEKKTTKEQSNARSGFVLLTFARRQKMGGEDSLFFVQ
jgi:hypothetical protein